jgi:hypothetical protein
VHDEGEKICWKEIHTYWVSCPPSCYRLFSFAVSSVRHFISFPVHAEISMKEIVSWSALPLRSKPVLPSGTDRAPGREQMQ